jgi:hypothetical protein
MGGKSKRLPGEALDLASSRLIYGATQKGRLQKLHTGRYYMVFPIPGARACNRGYTNSTCHTMLSVKTDESEHAHFNSGNTSVGTVSVDGRKHAEVSGVR